MSCIFTKTELIQRYFSKILLLPGIPYNFLKIDQIPFLAENLLLTASVRTWFINVRTVVSGMNKTLSYIRKKLIHR